MKKNEVENTYLVFEVAKGPKVIIESLDTYGADGWECCSMLTVAGNNIVCLKRRTDVEEDKGMMNKRRFLNFGNRNDNYVCNGY